MPEIIDDLAGHCHKLSPTLQVSKEELAQTMGDKLTVLQRQLWVSGPKLLEQAHRQLCASNVGFALQTHVPIPKQQRSSRTGYSD
jgi:hypothetical protein